MLLVITNFQFFFIFKSKHDLLLNHQNILYLLLSLLLMKVFTYFYNLQILNLCLPFLQHIILILENNYHKLERLLFLSSCMLYLLYSIHNDQLTLYQFLILYQLLFKFILKQLTLIQLHYIINHKYDKHMDLLQMNS